MKTFPTIQAITLDRANRIQRVTNALIALRLPPMAPVPPGAPVDKHDQRYDDIVGALHELHKADTDLLEIETGEYKAAVVDWHTTVQDIASQITYRPSMPKAVAPAQIKTTVMPPADVPGT